MGQWAYMSGMPATRDTSVCVWVCFPREYQSCVTAYRINGLGDSYQGDQRRRVGYPRETSGLRVRYWIGYRSAQAPGNQCSHVYIQQKAWLPATRLQMQTHHCNRMNILVSKLSAKKKLMAERQRQGRAQDSAMCDLGRTHIHPFPTIRLEYLTQSSQAEESAGRWLDRPPHMRLSKSQVTRSTFWGYASLVLPRQRRNKNLKQRKAHKGSPDMEDIHMSSSNLQYFIALSNSVMESLEVTWLTSRWTMLVPSAWAAVVLRLVLHKMDLEQSFPL